MSVTVLQCFVCWLVHKERGQTFLTTTTIQGACTTIYNLPCLLRDSRGGWRERERRGEGAVNFSAEEKTIVLWFPGLGPSVICVLSREALELHKSNEFTFKEKLLLLQYCLLFCQLILGLGYPGYEQIFERSYSFILVLRNSICSTEYSKRKLE